MVPNINTVYFDNSAYDNAQMDFHTIYIIPPSCSTSCKDQLIKDSCRNKPKPFSEQVVANLLKVSETKGFREGVSKYL